MPKETATVTDGGGPLPPLLPPPLWGRIVLGVCGLCLLIGFFLPWVRLGDLASLSGLELVVSSDGIVRAAVSDSQRWVLALCPVVGAVLTALGFIGFRFASQVAVVTGLLVIGYAVVTVAMIVLSTTALGLWIVLIGAVVAFLAGGLSWIVPRKARSDRTPSSDVGGVPKDTAA